VRRDRVEVCVEDKMSSIVILTPDREDDAFLVDLW
jgi:hypothetical protein